MLYTQQQLLLLPVSLQLLLLQKQLCYLRCCSRCCGYSSFASFAAAAVAAARMAVLLLQLQQLLLLQVHQLCGSRGCVRRCSASASAAAAADIYRVPIDVSFALTKPSWEIPVRFHTRGASEHFLCFERGGNFGFVVSRQT